MGLTITRLRNDAITATREIVTGIADLVVNRPQELEAMIARNILPLAFTYLLFQNAPSGWYTFGQCEVVCATTQFMTNGMPALCLSFCGALSNQ